MKKRLVSFLFFTLIFFALTMLFSINVNAEKIKDIYLANPDTKIDISKGDLSNTTNNTPPLIIIQGSDVTYKDIADMLYYGEQKLYPTYLTDYNSQIVGIDGNDYSIYAASSGSGSSWDSSTKIVTNLTGEKTFNKTQLSGYITLQFKNPETLSTQERKIPIIVLKNTAPTVSAPRIYISSEDFKNGVLTEDYIKSMLTISDGETILPVAPTNEPMSPEMLAEIEDRLSISVSGLNLSDFPKDANGYPTATVTKMLTIAIDDKTVNRTVPCFVTVLSETGAKTTYKKGSFTRSISNKYYPYHLSNIGKNADGTYVAKMKNNILYFCDKNGNFLKIDNKMVPVDACLTTKIRNIGTVDGHSVYSVTPLSKWITNGNCANLLISCLTGSNDEFVSSWTFDSHDIKTIQKACSDGILDTNFYYNYLTNGYCETGTKEPNNINRKTDKTPCGNGVTWYISGNTLYFETISGNDSHEIPDYDMLGEITTAPWVNFNFNKIVFDKNITRIGNNAFYGLECITESIEIPDSCVSIGNGAFKNCINLTGSLYTKNVFKIEDGAFENCGQMRGHLKLGDDALYEIGNSAFCKSGFTGSLTIPTSTVKIGSYAFADCINLSGSLIINDNVSQIGEYAFYNCRLLDGDIKLPYSLTRLEDFTFGNCISFNGKIWLNDNLTYIGRYAFYNCSNVMGDIRLPENVTTVDVGAFKNCRNLKTTVYINPRLIEIKADAFYGCGNIIEINNDNASTKLIISPRAFYVTTSVTTKISNSKNYATNVYNFFGDNRVRAVY